MSLDGPDGVYYRERHGGSCPAGTLGLKCLIREMGMIGKTISHYRILEMLGEGGMGVVYKAEDTKLERFVALKFLPQELTRDPDVIDRFIHEARAASALDHPNICTIHEINETDDGRMFICMAYYEGDSLKHRVEQGPMPVDKALDIGIQIAEGLARAHERGIVHRDIKPANIMITDRDMVKIVDFGLAKLAGKTKITKEGTTLGTIDHMSPEQTRGDEVDHRSDIWSLGVVLYEMLTGRAPFRGEYDQAVIYSILNEEPMPVTAVRADAPAEVDQIISRALAKNPDERFRQVSAFLDELQSLKDAVTMKRMEEKTGITDGPPSIAVLPFVNMSPDPENEYFGDGLAEELINALAQLKGLRVAARTSAFRFRGGETDLREVGKKLGVGTVLEGGVRRAGNRLRVTAQLINTENGYHLWSERYDREMEDIFAIQDEITAAIVKELEIKLLKGEEKQLLKRYTDNLEAYTVYMKGLYYWNSLTPEGYQKSIEYLHKAVEIDPDYALAYVGLAIWYHSHVFWGVIPPIEAHEKALGYLERAMALDDGIATAYNVLASINFSYDWDCVEAECNFRKTLELDPGDSMTHINYSLFLALQKRFDEARAETAVARRLDPLSPMIIAWAGMIPMLAGEREEAIKIFNEAIEIDPGYWQPYLWLGTAYMYEPKMEEAIAALERAVELSTGASIALSRLISAYYLAGETGKADVLFKELKEKADRMYVPPTFFANIHCVRGEEDEAFRWLDRAVEMRDGWLTFLSSAPPAIRPSGPRVDAILKTIGFP